MLLLVSMSSAAHFYINHPPQGKSAQIRFMSAIAHNIFSIYDTKLHANAITTMWSTFALGQSEYRQPHIFFARQERHICNYKINV